MKTKVRRQILITLIAVFLAFSSLIFLYTSWRVLQPYFLIFYVVLPLAFAVGGLLLKPWGWLLCVASIVLAMVSPLLYLISGDISKLGDIVIYGAILYYLFSTETKRAFGR